MGKTKLALNVILATSLVTSGCIKRVETPAVSPANTVGASVVLDQFLRAANARDLATMGSLFGTKDGPVTGLDSKDVVEARMFVFASLLAHEDYKVDREQIVPGRLQDATQLDVNITLKDKRLVVPFVLVRTKDGKWLVEQFDAQRITAGR